ncbi:hypothetical protein [Endozoicomonas elysicola]|uniref:Uncharacterized protein n=1 Tax=Endozoicomonas elysicola TaxID=305900 RepID=A0A081KAV9_9GAMM|nr:hypothetical protein [Endozoicomonas elysicola]KEI71285.1 hypothetical protein GV64_11525 [Endozoicomonas elysicola]
MNSPTSAHFSTLPLPPPAPDVAKKIIEKKLASLIDNSPYIITADDTVTKKTLSEYKPSPVVAITPSMHTSTSTTEISKDQGSDRPPAELKTSGKTRFPRLGVSSLPGHENHVARLHELNTLLTDCEEFNATQCVSQRKRPKPLLQRGLSYSSPVLNLPEMNNTNINSPQMQELNKSMTFLQTIIADI